MPADTVKVRVKLALDDGPPLGPGKIELLEAIRETGSIAAAGRRLAMSYKRAWTLVDELNLSFREPLVARSAGGRSGGGATLTALGEDVLVRYRRVEAATLAAARREFGALARAKRRG